MRQPVKESPVAIPVFAYLVDMYRQNYDYSLRQLLLLLTQVRWQIVILHGVLFSRDDYTTCWGAALFSIDGQYFLLLTCLHLYSARFLSELSQLHPT